MTTMNMASEFVGCTVIVTLKSPPNCRVEGEVADVTGHRLTLQNVTLLWNGQHLPVYHIESPGIADLEISSQPTPRPTAHSNGPINVHDGHFPPQQQEAQAQASQQQHHQNQNQQPDKHRPDDASQSFVDPAILSFKRPPRQDPHQDAGAGVDTYGNNAQGRFPSSPVMIGDSGAVASSRVHQPTPPILSDAFGTPQVTATGNSAAAATLTAPFSDLELNTGGGISEDKTNNQGQVQQRDVPEGRKGAAPAEAPHKYTGKRSRRGGKGKLQKDTGTQVTSTVEFTESHMAPAESGNKNFAGKGWRKTAFVEPAKSSNGSNSKSSRASKSRAARNHMEEQSGWATEEVTDIQEMGDFDFESNLSKFDKRKVFEEIRNDDTTPTEARLASFNRRVARPGTNGGKNLHYTENVLDSTPQPNAKWNSEAGETDEDYISDGQQYGIERPSSQHRSSPSGMQTQSRKGTTIVGAPSSVPFNILNRGQLASSRTGSPRPHRQGNHSSSPMTGSSGSAAGSLQITTTNRHCPAVSPLQMLEIEQLAISELGLTDDIITENAGRGIAEAAISLATALRASSTILIIAGNHRTGARAVAAARHFRNRGYRVSLCILGNDRESEFTDGFRKQIDIFKRSGGRVMRWEELSTRVAAADYIPELVVEALFGMHISFEDLRTDDQATAFEIISWANRCSVDVLSVDIPSGLSAISGDATNTQGSRLAISSKYVICLGAPKSGLLNALISGEGGAWQIAVADVGISQTAWKKYGTRRRHGVEFGNKWVVPLRFQLASP